MKSCSKCSRTLPITDFHMKGGGYRRPECKDCFKAARPRKGGAAAAGIPAGDKPAYQRYYKYGITPEQFQEMCDRQDGRCAVCGGAEPGAPTWQIDHDHVTGRVRGLLCRPCNVALGLLQDDIARIERAARYLSGADSDVLL